MRLKKGKCDVMYVCMYHRDETDGAVMMYKQDQTKATSRDAMPTDAMPTYQVGYTVILTTTCYFCNLLMSLYLTNCNFHLKEYNIFYVY